MYVNSDDKNMLDSGFFFFGKIRQFHLMKIVLKYVTFSYAKYESSHLLTKDYVHMAQFKYVLYCTKIKMLFGSHAKNISDWFGSFIARSMFRSCKCLIISFLI